MRHLNRIAVACWGAGDAVMSHFETRNEWVNLVLFSPWTVPWGIGLVWTVASTPWPREGAQ